MVMSKKRSREDAGLSAEGEVQLPFASPYTEGGLLQLQVCMACIIQSCTQ